MSSLKEFLEKLQRRDVGFPADLEEWAEDYIQELTKHMIANRPIGAVESLVYARTFERVLRFMRGESE